MDKKKRAFWERVITYPLLALLGAGTLWLWAVQKKEAPSPDWDKYLKNPMVQRLREYVRIDTSWPKAETSQAVAFWKPLLEAIGMKVTIFNTPTGRHDLVAEKGEGPDPPLILHHHMDTSELGDLGKWRHPPLAAETEGPYLYGRGAWDMKHIAVCYYYALKCLADQGWPLRRKIIFLATPTEESWEIRDGFPWLLKNHPEVLPEGSTVLSEGGVLEMVLDQLRFYGIEVMQAQIHTYELPLMTQAEEEEHEKKIQKLFEPQTITLHPTWILFLKKIAPFRVEYQAILMKADILAKEDPGKLLQLPKRYLHYMVPTIDLFSWKGKSTILYLTIPPGVRPEPIIERVENYLRKEGISFIKRQGSPYMEITNIKTKDYKIIEATVRQLYPQVEVGPYPAIGLTENQFLRARHYNAYGIGFLKMNLFDANRADHRDERIYLPWFQEALELAKEMITALAATK